MISWQKLVGWGLVIVSAFYLAWFVKERLFTAGPAIAHKEWVQVVGSIVIFMLGTANVRIAARRARASIPDNSPKNRT